MAEQPEAEEGQKTKFSGEELAAELEASKKPDYRLPTYTAEDQLPSGDEPGIYGDPDLHTVSVERARALRDIAARSEIPQFSDYGFGTGLEWAIDHLEPEVGRMFQAHGVAKGDPLVGLNTLLNEGVADDRVLYTMPLRRAGEEVEGFGAEIPKVEGGIIVVSEYGKHIRDSGIKYVLLGEEYSRVVDLLRNKYKGVTIIPWHDAPRVLTEAARAATGIDYPYVGLTEENRPRLEPAQPAAETGSIEVPRLADESDEAIW